MVRDCSNPDTLVTPEIPPCIEEQHRGQHHTCMLTMLRSPGEGKAGALTVLAGPPLILNTFAGMRQVDPAVLEAAKGVGISPALLFLRAHFPLALPVIVAGMRSAIEERFAVSLVGERASRYRVAMDRGSTHAREAPSVFRPGRAPCLGWRDIHALIAREHRDRARVPVAQTAAYETARYRVVSHAAMVAKSVALVINVLIGRLSNRGDACDMHDVPPPVGVLLESAGWNRSTCAQSELSGLHPLHEPSASLVRSERNPDIG